MNDWPPDYQREYLKRIHLLSEGAGSKETRQILMRYYASHPVDWINDWAITYDPRIKAPASKTMPFVLFQRQVEFIQFLNGCVYDKECGLVEKSRDVGATWLCCAYSMWLWLFTPGASIGWGSRKEILVDRMGDPDSIFQKMRMIIDSLPTWMLPAGFNFRAHAAYMKIINPVTKATITGESGDSIGRGGRSMIYFKDESAHYEHAESIEAALGDNTDVQIDISSVQGTNNLFYKRRMAGEIWSPNSETTKGKTRVFIFDWKDHPAKNQQWYDARRKKAEDEGVVHLFAREVDRDYSSSLDRIIIPSKWIKAAIDAHIKLGFGAEGKKIAALDVADEGGDKNAIAIRQGVVMTAAGHWGEGDTGETARRAVKEAGINGCSELYYDCIGVGAGIKAETNRLRAEGLISAGLQIYPWNAAASPDRADDPMIADDIHSPKNGDLFQNLKAQAWWSLAARFEKTYRAVTQGVKYDKSELISLPSSLSLLHEIEMELSQAQQSQNSRGKMVVDKKPDGGKSPNLADAIVMCYMPVREYKSGMGLFQLMEEQYKRDQPQGAL